MNRPILLSVGYSACHWCHVMAHESFEDPDVAAVMNALFVNIKVDREERPDVDHIYMSALQAMGERGGWPLTMFLTPQAEPFWGGTYFPKEPRFGRPGFVGLLQAVAHTYETQPERIDSNRGTLLQSLEVTAQAAAPTLTVQDLKSVGMQLSVSVMPLTPLREKRTPTRHGSSSLPAMASFTLKARPPARRSCIPVLSQSRQAWKRRYRACACGGEARRD